jgi:hypothetical protein
MSQLELPKYEATKSGDFPGFLVVWCPRVDCPSYTVRPFVVHGTTWMKKRMSAIAKKDGKHVVLRGRSCPYCFAASEIPARREIG